MKVQLTKRNEVFNQEVHSDVVYSKYDLSKNQQGSYSMGILYPIFCRNDITPGDKFELGSAPFLRFLPLISPALTDVDIDIRYFFVPRRILWNQWKNFITPNNADDAALVEPFIPNYEVSGKYVRFGNVNGSLYNYMGCSCIPWIDNRVTVNGSSVVGTHIVGSSSNVWNTNQYFGRYAPALSFQVAELGYSELTLPGYLKWPAYPFLAYNAIWNEYYRDENLQDEALSHITTGGAHQFYHFALKRCSWQKDYFSSALPWVTQSVFSTPTVQNGMSIQDLRETSALTKWLELQAIGGHRYQESILTHFGIRVPDEAAQIPVYLGGGRVPFSIGSVEQNSETNETPLATLAGRGTASGNMFVDKFEFREHGVVLGVMLIRPKAVYSDVTPRDLLSVDSRHDYLWPAFVNLGDEAIKADELNPGFFTYGNHDFGYQYRYASYRTSFDQVVGQVAPGESMESWSQARSWYDKDIANGSITNPPQISSGFIECRPSNRIFAVEDLSSTYPWWPSDNIVGSVVTACRAIRPLPSYIDPKLD